MSNSRKHVTCSDCGKTYTVHRYQRTPKRCRKCHQKYASARLITPIFKGK